MSFFFKDVYKGMSAAVDNSKQTEETKRDGTCYVEAK